MHGLPDKTEAFADIPNLSSCPDNLSRYSDGKAINCCEGEVVGGKCRGKSRCSLSGTGNLPRCADYLLSTGKDKSSRFCPKSMPNYYSADGKGRCTNSAIKSDGSGPVEKNPKSCQIFKTLEENATYADSCYNQRRLEEFKVTITQQPAEKRIYSGYKGRAGFVPSFLYASWREGLKTKTCYDRASFESHLDVAMSGWRSGNNATYNDMIKRDGSPDFCN